MHVKEITSVEEVEAIMQSDGPAVLIDFWAPWCGPCRVMGPQFASAAEVMADEPVEFYKVNTQALPEVAQAFSIRSIPTVLAISKGEIKDALIGAQDCYSIKRVAERLVAKNQGEGFFRRIFG